MKIRTLLSIVFVAETADMDMESDSSELERTGAAADDAEEAEAGSLQPPAVQQISDSAQGCNKRKEMICTIIYFISSYQKKIV